MSRNKTMVWSASLFFILSAALFWGFKTSAQNEPSANTNTSRTQTPLPTPAPTPIPVSDIIIQKEKTEKRLQDIEKKINEENPVPKVQKELEDFIKELNAQEEKTSRLLSDTPSLETLQETEDEWISLATQLFSLKEALQTGATERNRQQNELQQILKGWEESLQVIEKTRSKTESEKGEDDLKVTATSKKTSETEKLEQTSSPEKQITDEEKSEDNNLSEVNEEIKERISSTIEKIKVTQKKVADSLGEILNLEEKISGTQKQIADLQQKVKTAHDEALSRIIVRDSPPIWSAESLQSEFRQEVKKSVSDKITNFNNYVSKYRARILINFIVILILVFIFHLIRRSTRGLVKKEPELKHGLEVFESPIAIAVLLGIMFDSSIYPKMPEFFDSLMNVFGLTAMFFLIKHFVKQKYYPILIAIFTLYLVDDFRSLFATIPFLSRIWFLFEMLGGISFLVWLIRSKKILDDSDSTADKAIRKVSLILIAIFAFAFVAKALGYVTLAGVIGDTLITSILFGSLYYILIQFIDSLLIFVFRLRPFSKLRMVKNHSPLIQRKIRKFLKWTAIFAWINMTLSLLYIAEPIWAFIIKILFAGVAVGSISISIGGVVLFFITVGLSFLLSRFVRFALEEDVYQRVNLTEGLSYAASTILHYFILLFGFFIALMALGFDLTKFTILAGAFGVGLSFGLKNIFENFCSGLILLFERPVNVGDLVGITQIEGTLKHIGLRASVVRTVQGSEIIVPNAELITQQVTNWTLSDPLRRLEIEVGVEYGTNLREVARILENIGNRYLNSDNTPPAKAIFLGFGDSSLNFQLRVWTTDDEDWVALKSELSMDISGALDAAGIEIPFVQRDLHLKSIDEKVVEKIKLVRNEKSQEEKTD